MLLLNIGEPNPLAIYSSRVHAESVNAVPLPDTLLLLVTAIVIAGAYETMGERLTFRRVPQPMVAAFES